MDNRANKRLSNGTNRADPAAEVQDWRAKDENLVEYVVQAIMKVIRRSRSENLMTLAFSTLGVVSTCNVEVAITLQLRRVFPAKTLTLKRVSSQTLGDDGNEWKVTQSSQSTERDDRRYSVDSSESGGSSRQISAHSVFFSTTEPYYLESSSESEDFSNKENVAKQNSDSKMLASGVMSFDPCDSRSKTKSKKGKARSKLSQTPRKLEKNKSSLSILSGSKTFSNARKRLGGIATSGDDVFSPVNDKDDMLEDLSASSSDDFQDFGRELDGNNSHYYTYSGTSSQEDDVDTASQNESMKCTIGESPSESQVLLYDSIGEDNTHESQNLNPLTQRFGEMTVCELSVSADGSRFDSVDAVDAEIVPCMTEVASPIAFESSICYEIENLSQDHLEIGTIFGSQVDSCTSNSQTSYCSTHYENCLQDFENSQLTNEILEIMNSVGPDSISIDNFYTETHNSQPESVVNSENIFQRTNYCSNDFEPCLQDFENYQLANEILEVMNSISPDSISIDNFCTASDSSQPESVVNSENNFQRTNYCSIAFEPCLQDFENYQLANEILVIMNSISPDSIEINFYAEIESDSSQPESVCYSENCISANNSQTAGHCSTDFEPYTLDIENYPPVNEILEIINLLNPDSINLSADSLYLENYPSVDENLEVNSINMEIENGRINEELENFGRTRLSASMRDSISRVGVESVVETPFCGEVLFPVNGFRKTNASITSSYNQIIEENPPVRKISELLKSLSLNGEEMNSQIQSTKESKGNTPQGFGTEETHSEPMQIVSSQRQADLSLLHCIDQDQTDVAEDSLLIDQNLAVMNHLEHSFKQSLNLNGDEIKCEVEATNTSQVDMPQEYDAVNTNNVATLSSQGYCFELDQNIEDDIRDTSECEWLALSQEILNAINSLEDSMESF